MDIMDIDTPKSISYQQGIWANKLANCLAKNVLMDSNHKNMVGYGSIIPSVIFGFWLKNQPFSQKMAEFPKIWLDNDQKTVPTDLKSQYMIFIEKTNL